MGRRSIHFLSCCLLLLSIAGCNSGSITGEPVTTITPATAVLLPAQTVQFNATSNGSISGNTVWMVNNVARGHGGNWNDKFLRLVHCAENVIAGIRSN